MSAGPAYRNAEIKPYCSICGTVAGGACLRCGRPLCEAHAHDEVHRCPRCERAFERGSWVSATLALGTIVATVLPFMLSGWPRLENPSWVERYQQLRRQRFLQRRPRS